MLRSKITVLLSCCLTAALLMSTLCGGWMPAIADAPVQAQEAVSADSVIATKDVRDLLWQLVGGVPFDEEVIALWDTNGDGAIDSRDVRKQLVAIADTASTTTIADPVITTTMPAEPTAPIPTVTYTVSSASACVGDIIAVDVTVSEGHYMVNGQLTLCYDSAALELQAVSDDVGSPYLDSVNTAILSQSMWLLRTTLLGEATLLFASSASAGSATGGTIFTLYFRVLESACDSTTITLSIPEMKSSTGTSGDFVTPYETVNGVITVAKPSNP